MELWDIYNENGVKTGRITERGKPMQKGDFHLVVHIWIINSKGEFLISKRTPDKETFPNMWECSGGSALVGEDSLTAALRETREEIGVILKPENGSLFKRLRRENDHSSNFADIWIFKQEVDIDKVVYQPEETCDAKWATKDEILKMIADGTFVDVFTYLDELFEKIG